MFDLDKMCKMVTRQSAFPGRPWTHYVISRSPTVDIHQKFMEIKSAQDTPWSWRELKIMLKLFLMSSMSSHVNLPLDSGVGLIQRRGSLLILCHQLSCLLSEFYTTPIILWHCIKKQLCTTRLRDHLAEKMKSQCMNLCYLPKVSHECI